MPKTLAQPDPAKANRMIDQAIRQGRHAAPEAFQTVCQHCGNWCSGYFHRGFDGKYVCKACAAAMGVKTDPVIYQKVA